jgi:5-methyltetrahydropteroyltriglutamate--homocysteine methyltransferase
MSARTTPPFRADHVGSLLRPRALLEARAAAASGTISPDDLRAAEDAAIRDAVAMQADIGLRAVTDGEFRRASWHMDFIYEIAGVQKVSQAMKSVFHNADGDIEFTPSGVRVTGKLGMDHTIFGSAFEFLRDTAAQAAPGATPKLTIPAPSLVNYRGGPAAIDHAVYPDMGEFWDDLGAAYADEVARLDAIGCTYLQIDDTSLAYVNDPDQRAEITRRGEDADHQHEIYIKSINRALRDKPAGMTVTTHMCHGYFMEYDDERSGGFEPLRFVPKGKYVVLGLITSKNPQLEAKDDIKRRIEEAAKYVDIDQLCLSAQCGFSSTLDGNSLTLEQQIAKLRLVVDVAAEVWG